MRRPPAQSVQDTLVAAKLRYEVSSSCSVPFSLSYLSLCSPGRRSRDGDITRAGFQFALQTQFNQLWFYLLAHIDGHQGSAIVEALSLVFRLCFGQLGKVCFATKKKKQKKKTRIERTGCKCRNGNACFNVIGRPA